MSESGWLEGFVAEIARDPRLLVRTISTARGDEIDATAAAVAMIEDPAVQVLGYAALARRSLGHRATLLARVAGIAESLPDPSSRVGVLAAIFDALPRHHALDLLHRIRGMLEELTEDQQKRYGALLRRRSQRALSVPEVRSSFGVHEPRTFDIDEIARHVAKAHSRTRRGPSGSPVRIRAIGTRAGVTPTVRLEEIGASLGIEPSRVAFAAVDPVDWLGVAAQAGTPTIESAQRVVSTGFANDAGEPDAVIIEPGASFRYFIEIGAPVEGAIESEQALPDLEAGAVIHVVLFTNEDGLVVDGPSSGRFRIEVDGVVVVSERAATIDADDTLLQRRMFFAFRAPMETRECGFRCSFYCRGVLIQSRSIVVPVGMGRRPAVKPDYVLSRTLSRGSLAQLEPPTLSVMLNENVDGTHSFRFYGSDGAFTRSSTFGPLELRDHIMRARKGLRLAAWGTTEEWIPGDRYRFGRPRTIDGIMPDLLDLARRGRVLWDAVIDKLAGGPDAADALHDMMRASGLVQFALKEEANAVLPMSLFYDHELDVSHPDDQMVLCETFIRSLGGNLAEGPCLIGSCPNRERPDVVCPGGFWGFRHAIGFPISIGAEQAGPPQIPPFMTSTSPSFAAAVSTDPKLARRDSHLATLELRTGIRLEVEIARDPAIAMMRRDAAPIIYFYCHGGMNPIEGPFLEVGPTGGPRLARNALRKIRWRQMRPIVFINGCDTTGVTPEEALDLVSVFVTRGASGVIGTEITVFESLAAPFAEAFFEELVSNARAAGEALRRARLRILKDSLNPLGLAYIPFVLASQRLCQPATTQSGTATTM